ncbi:MAG: SDR family oxidoreductase, partial [Acidobacteriota bacterium]
NGKLDRRALPQPDRPESAAYLAPSGETERTIAAIWQELLRIERVGTHDSFFDLGGHSLLLAQVQSKLQQAFGREIPMVELFRHPTVSALAGFLAPQRGAELQEQPGLRRAELRRESVQQTGSEIAIIAMTGRFPAADNIDELWRNLREGVESVTFYSDEELLAAGVDPAVLKDPHYVKAGTSLDKPEWFDAQLFGISPREAELMDPQQRIFLECAWEALELAGYDPQGYGGAIGVYAGIAINHYLVNLYSNPQETGGAGGLQLMVGNDKDFLPTRVSYKLNLKGPSVTVQTACSTSLVATHLACQGLLHGECDMALAGGVSISNYRKAGYFYQEEGIMSPDGHCRAFDARAQGTVPGNGAGLVVLKRLTDALEDGDTIRAVIKGSAINNDGSGKIGFTAPSIEGQTAVIAEALAMAGVEPREVSYVEAHGTATPLGDPIEVAALKNVFGSEPGRSCALGSVKTNFGHLDTAAGVTGLIKTVLALEHRQIPPSLHFEQPNPEIDLEHSPFYVNTVHREWPAGPGPRRAGVSSFGLGGTNAHLVLEEAPGSRTSDPPGPRQLLVLSARTGEALEQATTRLAEHFRQHPELNLADAAYTLQVGRQACEHRRILVGRDPADAAAALLARDPARVVTREAAAASPSLVFLFPGQGAQAVNMGRELYEVAPVFRHEVDRAAEILRPHLGLDVRSLLYPLPEESEAAEEQLRQTALTQPALFVVEHALARLWMDLVGPPKAMIGHSLGEYVAACLAGVFSLEDALYLVAERGRLMGAQPAGAMLAVPLAESEVAPLLGPELDLAAVNAAQRTVVAGPAAAIEALAESLADRNVETRRLETSHAFHSASMEPVLEPFRQCLRRIDLQAPQIPFVSNLTGDWIDPSEATGPDTWVRHLRSTVRFSEGLDRLLDDPDALFLEIGPGRTLSSLLRRQGKEAAERLAIPSLATDSNAGELTAWLAAVGRLWASGYRVDWRAFQAGQRRHRVVLPTYPFERQPYWIEPGQAPPPRRQAAKRDLEHWFYVPTWKLSAPLPAAELAEQGALCLLLGDSGGLAEQVGERLRAVGWQVVTACPGPGFTRRGDRAYEIDPGRPQNYGELIAALLEEHGAPPRHIVHCWSLTGPQRKEGEPFETVQARGFDSLLCLTRALEEQGVIDPVTVTVLSDGVQSVDGAERLAPAKATLLGALKVIPQECPNLACRSIDVRLPEPGSWEEEDLSVQLAVETVTEVGEAEVAYRPTGRWVRRFEAIPVPEKVAARPRLREHGVYLLTGGLGRIGLALAEFLGRTLRARLILLGRSSFPAREEWSRILDEGDEDQAESQDSLAGALGRAWGDRQDLRPKIRQLRELEEAGAEVLVLRADVTDPQQMAEAIRRARQRFGEIHGVVHLAGELQRAVMPIAETDPETSR